MTEVHDVKFPNNQWLLITKKDKRRRRGRTVNLTITVSAYNTLHHALIRQHDLHRGQCPVPESVS